MLHIMQNFSFLLFWDLVHGFISGRPFFLYGPASSFSGSGCQYFYVVHVYKLIIFFFLFLVCLFFFLRVMRCTAVKCHGAQYIRLRPHLFITLEAVPGLKGLIYYMEFALNQTWEERIIQTQSFIIKCLSFRSVQKDS